MAYQQSGADRLAAIRVPSRLAAMKDPAVRSKLERLRLTASTPDERAQIGRVIEVFEAAPDDAVPAEVTALLKDRGVYIDEDAHRREH